MNNLIIRKNARLSLLVTILAYAEKDETWYSRTSVDDLRQTLIEWHGIDIGKRWTFQCLHDLEASGYITRHPRYLRHSNGTIKRLSSLITISAAGAKLLIKEKVSVASVLLKKLEKRARG